MVALVHFRFPKFLFSSFYFSNFSSPVSISEFLFSSPVSSSVEEAWRFNAHPALERIVT